jgi:NADH dehydrogenase [ubiquinone] 1 alpha subcomplex assembly factor 7
VTKPNLKARLLAQIAQDGPMTVAQYMAACLYDPEAGYYATRPGIGLAGDFVTAPEISQMFGELLGLWAAESWREIGAPAPVQLVEVGPGRGVLMQDAWRAAGIVPGFRAAAKLTFVEINPGLRDRQGERLADAAPAFADRLEDVAPGPMILIGNEFLDCMPVRQFINDHGLWRERLIGRSRDAEDELAYGLSREPLPDLSILPPPMREAPEGAIAEVTPALAGFVETLAARLHAAKGRALFIDYGRPESDSGDTFQAMRAHAETHPLASPGEDDLTAHVDFGELARLARAAGLDVAGPIGQGPFLSALGIGARAQALAAKNPARAEDIEDDLERLVSPDQMGALFQVMCLSSPGLPPAQGFGL